MKIMLHYRSTVTTITHWTAVPAVGQKVILNVDRYEVGFVVEKVTWDVPCDAVHVQLYQDYGDSE